MVFKKQMTMKIKEKIIKILKENIKKAEFNDMSGFGVIADNILDLFQKQKIEERYKLKETWITIITITSVMLAIYIILNL